jgi:hypothetical protein
VLAGLACVQVGCDPSSLDYLKNGHRQDGDVSDIPDMNASEPNAQSADAAIFDALGLDTLAAGGSGGTSRDGPLGGMTTRDAFVADKNTGSGGEKASDGGAGGSDGNLPSTSDAEADAPAVTDAPAIPDLPPVADAPAASDTIAETHPTGGQDGARFADSADGTGGGNGPDVADGSDRAGDASEPSQVGYWSFNETVAGSYADPWGGNAATGTGVAVNPNGAWGNALRLGTAAVSPATAYLSLPTNADVITTSYTVALWVYPNDFANATTDQALVTWDGGAIDCDASHKGFRLRISAGGHFTADTNCGAFVAQKVTPSDVQGKWSFVALTITGASWTLYLYNQGACTTPISSFPKTANISGFTGFASSGTWHFGASGTDHQLGFNGSIDEVHFWNRGLSQAEIVNLCTCNLTSCP